jgi:MscS family membrane protein
MAVGSSEEQVREALAIVREIVEDHEGMSADRPPRVYFDQFNPDSLSIVIFYWYEPADYWAFCELAERINLEIVRRFAEAGIELVPPTTTTRITSETGDPLELRSSSTIGGEG